MSSDAIAPPLATALKSIAPPGVLVGHRVIRRGDDDGLLPEERIGFRPSAPKIYRQSGAARIVARHLLSILGFSSVALPRSMSGAAVWPPGVIGSLAHDEEVAVAAITNSSQFSALGIDVEPAVPLPPELVMLVATSAERRCYSSAVIGSRILFAIKEAIYKALNPLDDLFLDFQDIEVDLFAKRGHTRNGETVEVVFTVSPRIVAISFK